MHIRSDCYVVDLQDGGSGLKHSLQREVTTEIRSRKNKKQKETLKKARNETKKTNWQGLPLQRQAKEKDQKIKSQKMSRKLGLGRAATLLMPLLLACFAGCADATKVSDNLSMVDYPRSCTLTTLLPGPTRAPLTGPELCVVCHDGCRTKAMHRCCPDDDSPSLSSIALVGSWLQCPVMVWMIVFGLLGEVFTCFLKAWIIHYKIRKKMHEGFHNKTRPRQSPSWGSLEKAGGPWRTAFMKFHNPFYPGLAARKIKGRRVKGIHGLVGLGRCWRKSPRSWQSRTSSDRVHQCFRYLKMRTRRDNPKASLTGIRFRTELRGGAGGKAAKERKRNESLTSALTSFLHSWLQSNQYSDSDTRPWKRRHIQGPVRSQANEHVHQTEDSGDTSLAKKLLAKKTYHHPQTKSE